MYKRYFKSFSIRQQNHPQFSPFAAALYVKASKGQRLYAQKIDSSSLLTPAKITRVQKIVGIFLYYVRDIDNTLLPALNIIAKK